MGDNTGDKLPRIRRDRKYELDVPNIRLMRKSHFVEEYLKDFLPGKAALRAGYKYASTGSKLLRDPDVARTINARYADSKRCEGITPERVKVELERLAFGNACVFFDEAGQPRPLSQVPEDAQRTLASVESKVTWSREVLDDGAERQRVDAVLSKHKVHDKVAALGLLAKVLGMTKERVEHSGPGGGPIQVADGREKLTAALDDLERKISGGEAGSAPEGGAGRVGTEPRT